MNSRLSVGERKSKEENLENMPGENKGIGKQTKSIHQERESNDRKNMDK